MKYFTALFLFIFAAATAHAQMNNPMIFTYKQKRLNDSLNVLFPDLQKGNEMITTQHKMPVFILPNKSMLIGKNALGKIYKMKEDNMLCLKPKETNATMPNAFIGEIIAAPDEK